MTKFRILFFIVFLLSSVFVYGQSSIGIKGGVNFAQQSIEGFSYDTIKFDQITGYAIGVDGDLEISEFFSIQTEFLLIQKGRKFLSHLNVGTVEFREETISKIDYFEIPLLAKLKLGNDLVKGYAIVGPSFGFALSGSEEVRTSSSSQVLVEKKDLDFKDSNYSRYEIGAHLGFGVSFNFGSIGIFSDVRYLFSFNNLDLSEEDITIKNNGFAVMAGVFFPFSN